MLWDTLFIISNNKNQEKEDPMTRQYIQPILPAVVIDPTRPCTRMMPHSILIVWIKFIGSNVEVNFSHFHNSTAIYLFNSECIHINSYISIRNEPILMIKKILNT